MFSGRQASMPSHHSIRKTPTNIKTNNEERFVAGVDPPERVDASWMLPDRNKSGQKKTSMVKFFVVAL